MPGMPWRLPGLSWRRCGRWSRRRGATTQAPPPELVLIGRAGCHLCEEMLDEVCAAVAEPGVRQGATVRELDLDAARAAGEVSEADHARWSALVPVLLVDGREVAQLRLDPAALRSALRPGRGGGRSFW